MDFLKSIAIAASGLRAQAGRMRIISENLANADSTAQRSDTDPFRRRIPTFRSEFDRTLGARLVALGKIRTIHRISGSNTNRAIPPPMPTATSSTRTSIRWWK